MRKYVLILFRDKKLSHLVVLKVIVKAIWSTLMRQENAFFKGYSSQITSESEETSFFNDQRANTAFILTKSLFKL